MDDRELLAGAYRDFNARRLDAVLARLHPDVTWANGMEGGHVRGVEAVRAYWTASGRLSTRTSSHSALSPIITAG